MRPSNRAILAGMRTYEDLTFYQDMYALSRELYRALPMLPTDERYGLAHQMRTSAVSVLSNIAEGSGRGTDASTPTPSVTVAALPQSSIVS